MLEKSSTIKICNRHEEMVPLIWTFAFPYAEYWCPYCGAKEGMMGAGKDVPITKELKKSLSEWKKKSRSFLAAMSQTNCAQMMWFGKWTKPKDLPQWKKDRIEKVKKEWVYEGKN